MEYKLVDTFELVEQLARLKDLDFVLREMLTQPRNCSDSEIGDYIRKSITALGWTYDQHHVDSDGLYSCYLKDIDYGEWIVYGSAFSSVDAILIAYINLLCAIKDGKMVEEKVTLKPCAQCGKDVRTYHSQEPSINCEHLCRECFLK